MVRVVKLTLKDWVEHYGSMVKIHSDSEYVLFLAKGGILMCSSPWACEYLLDNPIDLNQMGYAKR